MPQEKIIIKFLPDGNIERRSFYEDSHLLGEWIPGEIS